MPEETEETPRADPKEKLVVVVDDDPGVRELLELVIKREGFQFACAKAGREGLDLIQKLMPALVFLDLMLPDSGGYEVLRELQGTEAARIPIIVMTGRNADPGTRDMMRQESNVIDFLPKPLQPSVLGMRLHEILKTRPAASGLGPTPGI